MAKKKEKQTAFEKLSVKHQLFVMNIIKHFGNKTRAYMDTYPKASKESARTKGPDLFAKVGVKAAIDEKYAEVYADIQSEAEKSKTYQLIKALGDTTIEDIMYLENGKPVMKDGKDIPPHAIHAIQSVETDEKPTKFGMSENVKVKLNSKIQALKLRAEIQRLVDPDDSSKKIEIIVKPAERPTDDKE